jgi:mRNA interferase MazF
MGMGMTVPRRGEVYLVSLDPTQGREIKKPRPCVIVSPDELNSHLNTYIVAPMTTGGHSYPFRIPCRFQRKDGFIVIDQLRTVDGRRLIRRLGKVHGTTMQKVLRILQEMFAD